MRNIQVLLSYGHRHTWGFSNLHYCTFKYIFFTEHLRTTSFDFESTSYCFKTILFQNKLILFNVLLLAASGNVKYLLKHNVGKKKSMCENLTSKSPETRIAGDRIVI